MDIDTKVTPSLHPHNVEAIEGYDNETAPAVELALGAFRAAYDGLSDVHKARQAAAANPTLNDAARLLQVAAFAEKHQNTITRRRKIRSSSSATPGNGLVLRHPRTPGRTSKTLRIDTNLIDGGCSRPIRFPP